MSDKLHKAFERQLLRMELNENALPDNINKWQEFLKRINRYYHDTDQDRYLLERSMEISSREMQDLNSKLEEAQQLASLGYWHYDRITGESIWSKELYQMFKLSFRVPVPTLDDIFKLTHKDDVNKIKNLINRAFSHGEKYETEVRMRAVVGKEEYRWYHIIGNPKPEENAAIYRLSGIAIDITERKEAELEVASLQQQLLTSARRAGMADVATSILHNVGNILNSVNVSMHLIDEHLSDSDFNKLLHAEKMIMDNKENISQFFLEDEKGRLIPQYLISYTSKLQNNYSFIQNELRNLMKHIEHVKAITEMQKSLSGVSGVSEKVYVPEIIDMALKMCGDSFEKKHITLVKDMEEIPCIVTDKSKLLQILVNLFQNANDALVLNEQESVKKLCICLKKIDADNIQIQVKDNGVGIDKDNLIKIFSFGFTTKKTGHGFGLHSSALAAKEIGGKLEANSDGYGKGAIFYLTLPLSILIRGVVHEHEPELTSHSD